MTSESSLDSSSKRSLVSSSPSAGPYRKRCRYPTTLVPSSTPISRSIALTHADLLPPRKRFRDSYLPKDSREEHMEIGTTDAEAIADLGISDGVGAYTEDGIGMGVEIAASNIREDEEELAEALANYEATRAANALETKNQSQNGSDGDNGNGGNRDGGNNGNGNPNENGRGAMPVAHVCTYQDFVNCQLLNFKGTKGVVGLTRWFEKMETVFHISNCLEVYQVKYATCTLLDSALTWWNSHKRTIGVDAAFTMTWRDLMKLMAEVYCPRNEIQKMENELWNLTVKNNDLAAYTKRFQELTLLCSRMVSGEEDRIERYVGGLPNNIHGNVMSAEPTRLQDATRFANSLMDQKLKGYAIRSVENKQSLRAIKETTVHNNPSSSGRMLEDRMWPEPIQLVERKFQEGLAKLKNQNHGNKLVIPEARGKAYAIGGGDANPGFNIVMDVSYAVKLANGRIAKTNTVLRGCTIRLLGHPFNIDLMPVELGSFEVIIGMDWMANNLAVIICDEKIVRIPFGDMILIVQGDMSDKNKKSTLSIISCTKTQKYMENGCQVFLAQVTKKEDEVKSQEKRLEDVPIIRKFTNVFPEDLPRLPPA
ncbi:putative reverse transcriptase domain-containing protein [Tanacetum coccineum]